jgi:hypothetical protein
MALSATFTANFASFYDAVDKADAKLKDFGSGADKVGGRLNTLANQFSGQKIVQEATIVAKAVEEIGGVSNLTERELQKLGKTAQEAAEKLGKLGKDVPAGIAEIANAAKDASAKTSVLNETFGQLVSALSVSSLINKAASGLVGIGKAAIENAGKLVDMNVKTGVSIEGLQRMGFVAEHTSTTVEAFADVIFKMGTNVEKGSKETVQAVEKLGISFKDFRAQSPEEQFNTLVKNVDKLGPAGVRNADLVAIGGKAVGEAISGMVDGYERLAAQATVTGAEQIRAIDTASEKWDEFTAKIGTHITTTAGNIVILTGALSDNKVTWSEWLKVVTMQAGAAQNAAIAALATKGTINELTDAQKKLIAEEAKLGSSLDWIAGLTHASKEAIEAYEKSLNSAAVAHHKTAEELAAETKAQSEHEAAVKKANDAILAQKAAIQALADTYTGKALAAEIAKVTEAIRVAGGIEHISGQQLEALAKQAKAFQAAGGTLSPVLQTIEANFLTFADAGIKVESGLGRLVKLLPQVKLEAKDLSDVIAAEDAAFALMLAKSDARGLPQLGIKGSQGTKVTLSPEPAAKTNEWAQQVELLSQEFVKLGQAAGGSIGSILSGTGQAIVLMEAAQKSTEQIGINGKKLGGSFGPISTMFNDNATSAQKWGATIQAGSAIASGAMDVWASSANQGSKAANVLGGTMAGAKAGAAFGPWGMAIGAAAGALTGFIRNLTAGRKAVEEFAKTQGGFDELHKKLGQLGADGEKMWVQLTQNTRKGDLAGAQAEIDKIKAALGGVEEAFAKAAASPAGTMWDKSFQTLIADSEKLGMNLDKIAELKAGQVKNAAAGFASAVGVTAGAAKQLAADQAKLADVLAKAPSGQALDPSTQAEVEALNQDLKDQQGIIDATGLHSQHAASAIAGSIAGIIAANMAAGESFVSAVREAGPTIEGLADELKRTGLDGGEAFAFIKSEADLVNDAVAGPALTAIEGLTAGMVGLSNAGLLTQDMFGGLSEQITGTFQSLVDQGKDGPAILAAMQPDLQALWEAQEKFGYTTDEATQKLLDQAEAAGLVGEKHKPVNEQMLDALTKIEAAAGRIADALAGPGQGSITAATKTAAGELSKLPKSIDIQVQGRYVPPDIPGGGGAVTPPDYGGAQAAGGDYLVTRPTMFLAGEAGAERVTFRPQGGGRGGAGGGVNVGGVSVNISGGAIDEAWLRRGGARQIADAVAAHLGRSLGVAPV